mgnify:CR=1 FL=1
MVYQLFAINDILTTDINKIKDMIDGEPLKMKLIFLLLSTIRIIFFIPQTIFIIDKCRFHFGIPCIGNAINDVKVHDDFENLHRMFFATKSP